MARTLTTISTERIDNAILFIRGEKVILDRDLATLYGVETRVLNQSSYAESGTVSRGLHV